MKRLSRGGGLENRSIPQRGEVARFRFETFQVVDMMTLPQRRVHLTVLPTPQVRPGDEIDLQPYGLWQVASVEDNSRPDVTTLIVRHLPE